MNTDPGAALKYQKNHQQACEVTEASAVNLFNVCLLAEGKMNEGDENGAATFSRATLGKTGHIIATINIRHD